MRLGYVVRFRVCGSRFGFVGLGTRLRFVGLGTRFRYVGLCPIFEYVGLGPGSGMWVRVRVQVCGSAFGYVGLGSASGIQFGVLLRHHCLHWLISGRTGSNVSFLKREFRIPCPDLSSSCCPIFQCSGSGMWVWVQVCGSGSRCGCVDSGPGSGMWVQV
jgi:hypothetical protein